LSWATACGPQRVVIFINVGGSGTRATAETERLERLEPQNPVELTLDYFRTK
jgi:hypothetical protein